MVLEAFRGLREAEPGLLLVLAPRHPDRFDAAALRPWSGAWVRWSEAPDRVPPETAVVLLDTIGELADCYAAATVACVGGTWSDRGGHNLLEPAFHGVPVVFGPDFRHFDEEGRALLAAGGGFVAADAAGIRERCRTPARRPGGARRGGAKRGGGGAHLRRRARAAPSRRSLALLPGAGGGRRA